MVSFSLTSTSWDSSSFHARVTSSISSPCGALVGVPFGVRVRRRARSPIARRAPAPTSKRVVLPTDSESPRSDFRVAVGRLRRVVRTRLGCGGSCGSATLGGVSLGGLSLGASLDSWGRTSFPVSVTGAGGESTFGLGGRPRFLGVGAGGWVAGVEAVVGFPSSVISSRISLILRRRLFRDEQSNLAAFG